MIERLRYVTAQTIRALVWLAHFVLSVVIDEERLLSWKPIHLCWWFEKHGYEVPRYFIAGGGIYSGFLEPGGDATYSGALFTTFTGTIATDFVHGYHAKSIAIAPSTSQKAEAGTLVSSLTSGCTISAWIYLNALPTSTATFCQAMGSGVVSWRLRLTSAGVLQLWSGTAQLGSDGPTLSTGAWHRVSMSSSQTSTSVNQFNVYLDGTSAIAVTNATLGATPNGAAGFGNYDTDTTLDFRISDIYGHARLSGYSDVGEVWVTLKRPVSNGTTNGFTTQIGSGGTGYGSGHAPQVNERPINSANGWSVTSSSAVTEEYTIEAASVGDVDISAATFLACMGWASVNPGATPFSIIVQGATTGTVTTGTQIMLKPGTSGYPSGGNDIGVLTGTTAATYRLYDCGVNVAYIPAAATTQSSGIKSLFASVMRASLF